MPQQQQQQQREQRREKQDELPLNKRTNCQFLTFEIDKIDQMNTKTHRKRTKFYLIDTDSIRHLAVVADEDQHKDGVYVYTIVDEFKRVKDCPKLKRNSLVCVRKWLKDRILQSSRADEEGFVAVEDDWGKRFGKDGNTCNGFVNNSESRYGNNMNKKEKVVMMSAAQLARKRKMDACDGESLIDHDSGLDATLRAKKMEEREFKWCAVKANAFSFIRGTAFSGGGGGNNSSTAYYNNENTNTNTNTNIKVEDFKGYGVSNNDTKNDNNNETNYLGKKELEDSIKRILRYTKEDAKKRASAHAGADCVDALKTLKSSRLHLKRIALDDYELLKALKSIREDGKNAKQSTYVSTASKLASDVLKHVAGSILGSVSALITTYDRVPGPQAPKVKPGYLVQLVDGAGNVISQADPHQTTKQQQPLIMIPNNVTTTTTTNNNTTKAITTLIAPSLKHSRGTGGASIKDEPNLVQHASPSAAGVIVKSNKKNNNKQKGGKKIRKDGKRKLKDVIANAPADFHSSLAKKQKIAGSRSGDVGISPDAIYVINNNNANTSSAKKSKKEKTPKAQPLGKGRKRCHVCATVVGSPTRTCPSCQTALPMKAPSVTKKDKLSSALKGGELIQDVGEAILDFRRIFTNCKPSILKTGVAKLIEELKERLDDNMKSGGVEGGDFSSVSPGSALNKKFILEELMTPLLQKIEITKLFNGANERPKGRREVLEALDGFIASYYS